MNVGYAEALKRLNFSCFIFHDVDLIPEDDRNFYGCPLSPAHMSVAVDKFRYQYVFAFQNAFICLYYASGKQGALQFTKI